MGCGCRGGARAGAQTAGGVIQGYRFTAPNGETRTFLTLPEAKAARRQAGGGTVIVVKNPG